jgi:predicted acylesterase/phospholipase RssA
MLRLFGLVFPPLLLVLWLRFAGSYSWPRDIALITLVTAAVAAVLLKFKPSVKGASVRSSTHALFAGITVPIAFTWFIACWFVASAGDVVFQPSALSLKGSVAVPAAARPDTAKLKIAVALSGGGYRAALVHAGVLQELGRSGIPVTNLASVSGGSIIAAFVAQGGDPADFVDAVKTGRFRIKRELFSAFTFPRWILPFGSYSRRDVQASLVRRVLLANEPSTTARPALLLAMTDLRYGLSIGATARGLMVVGPTTERFFAFGEAITISELADQADMVAISGAFPGAFPAKHTVARLSVSPEPLAKSRDTRTMPLALVDGGVRDNLGLRLLQGIDREARGTGNNSISWPGFNPGAEWALDLIILSDGGQSFEVAEGDLGLLAQVSRAINLSGLETGILRPIPLTTDLPIIPLSIAAEMGLSPDAVIVQSAVRAHAAARRDTFRVFSPDDPTLLRMVDLLPSRERAYKALADYKRTRSIAPINVGDLDMRCASATNRDAPECHWRTLVDVILDDIDSIISVFRRSATLEDQYIDADADALVRLGRYFVLLKFADIQQALAGKDRR